MWTREFQEHQRSTTSSSLELRRSVLVPRRFRDFRQRPVEVKVNHRWIKEGRVTDNDCYPELRTAQLLGRELCVIGASTEACCICTEAWHSGFKPVLVLLEDKIDEQRRKEVESAASTLQWMNYKSGTLRCGFQVLVTESPHVKVSLDREGHAVAAKVTVMSSQTSSSSIRKTMSGRSKGTSAKKQYSFQGPVIVLGGELGGGMADDTHEHSLSLHKERVSQTSAAVTKPEFWEERYDPDCLSLVTSSYGVVIPCYMAAALQTLLLVLSFHFIKEPLFVLIRIPIDAVAKLPILYSNSINGSYMIGMRAQPWPTAYHIFITMITWLANCVPMLFKISGHLVVSDFGAGLFWITASVFFIPLYAKIFAKVRLTRWSYVWYLVALQGTGGAYMSSVPILLSYQYLLGVSSTAASVFLSLAFSASEVCLVKVVSLGYDKIVVGRREDGIPCVVGDQKMSLSLTLTSIHLFSETARLSALICGAIGAESERFLGDAATSLLTALIFNTLARTGMLSTIVVHIPVLGQRFCPTTHWGMHNNAKFTMGWGRFIIILGLMLGRGLLHWQWDIPWKVPDAGPYGSWCWSGIVLLTFAMAFGVEVLEDILVYAFCRDRIPQPRSQIYRKVMQRRLENPNTNSLYHPCHYTLPRRVTEDEALESEGLQGLQEEDWHDCIFAPGLTNVRVYAPYVMLAFAGTSTIIVLTNLSIGVGSANMMGFCKPSDDFSKVLINVFLYSMQCDS